MSTTEIEQNAEQTTPEVETPEQAPKMTLEEAGQILAAHPVFTGMWGMTQPSLARVTELAEVLRKVTVTDKDVTDAIAASEEESVVKAREAIEKLRKQAAEKEAKLREEVKAALKGDDMTPEEEQKARDEFKAEKDKVNSVITAFQKIAFSGGDDDSQEFKALQTILTDAPVLKGTGVKFGQKITGADQSALVREWVRTNRPEIEVNDRGRISKEALDAYKAAHPNGHDKS